MPNPTFSIILPTYNRAHILWRAVQSVLDQSLEDWELIVIDDGSEDCTLRLLEEFHHPSIDVTSTVNRGPSAARNTGIGRATGEFVAYLDSDNRWHPDFLKTFSEYIAEYPEHVLWYCGQHCRFWERRNDGSWVLENEKDLPRAQYALSEVLGLAGADTNSMVHRRLDVSGVVAWDEDCNWLEDWDFFLRVTLAFPGQLKWVPEILYEYRQVHGEGADGICAEAREDRTAEHTARQYLLEKWRDTLTAEGRRKLGRSVADLQPIRA